MYTPIIGLEIHVELKTKSKMFCSCVNDPFIDTPNVNICEVCLAHPGTLPVPNQAAILATMKISQALGCTVAKESKFDRKHYFYPDLPKGYQISQFDQPIGEHGKITLRLTSGKNHRPEATIGITRVHLEEDTAKLSHTIHGTSLVDFNRAGVPLVEMVSDPDIQSAEEAKNYCQELQLILRTLGVSQADMEKGQMRCEANISVQTTGSFTIENGVVIPAPGHKLNAKVEVKNINSFRAVERAIEYEIKRQSDLLDQGKTWESATRGWDETKGATVHQRSKESAADYRYFPEPDIPPFKPHDLAPLISIPELPQSKRDRFIDEYGFSVADAFLLTSDKNWAEFTEDTMSDLYSWLKVQPDETMAVDKEAERRAVAKLTGGWITTKLMGAMAERAMDIRILKIQPENFAELITLIYTNKVNSTNGSKILNEMLDSGVDLDPSHVLEEKGYGQISDEATLLPTVQRIIEQFPAQAAQFKAGKEPLIKFLVGMVMKETEGSADPLVAEKILRQNLSA
jgi:aspartyl-tRNA(Asn)/glutamyl-tRNA(Gln) amidotransferase subunit B